MKTSFYSFLVCLLLCFGAFGQDDNGFMCTLNDSSYYKDSLQNWGGTFKKRFGLRENSVNCPLSTWKTFLANTDQKQFRFYFLAKDDTLDQCPGLVIVPVSNLACSEDSTSYILSIWNDPDKAKITDTAFVTSSMKNWNSIILSNSMSQYDSIIGYNFRRRDLIDPTHSSPTNVEVLFGISNINNSNSSDDEIHMYIKVVGIVDDNMRFVDFSKPCPQLCGSTLGGGTSGK